MSCGSLSGIPCNRSRSPARVANRAFPPDPPRPRACHFLGHLPQERYHHYQHRPLAILQGHLRNKTIQPAIILQQNGPNSGHNCSIRILIYIGPREPNPLVGRAFAGLRRPRLTCLCFARRLFWQAQSRLAGQVEVLVMGQFPRISFSDLSAGAPPWA